MLQIIDRISSVCARLSAWLFFIIGGIIVFEVVARYVFLSPTVWGEEMSRFLQIWATYLAAAYVLHKRKLIAIDVVVNKLAPWLQKVLDSCALLVIMVFCLVACVYGVEIALESIRVGRATSTMLAVPSWMTEIAIPIGFGLMFIQALAELFRTLTGTSAGAVSLS
jgi:TRAP-type C4-dicarboxylate transport system permease small subunit